MKKLLLLLTILVISVSVTKAQTQSATIMPVTSVSYSNTGADTATIKATGVYANITIQANVTKISGTVAGKVFVWVSLDGANYSKITTDSAVLVNTAVNSHLFNLGASKYLFYRTIVTGTGTSAAGYKSYFLGR